MLAELTFDLVALNRKFLDKGVSHYYENQTFDGYDEPLKCIISEIDVNHPFWVDKKYKPSTTKTYFGIRIEPGLYHSNRMKVFLQECTSHEFVDSYSMFSSFGSILTAKEQEVMIEKNDYTHYSTHPLGSYGVADNYTQVLARYASVLMHPEYDLVFEYRPVRKADQPEEGGWRWHKWGEYIGTHQPSQEYLYDEKDIDELITFHVHILRKKK